MAINTEKNSYTVVFAVVMVVIVGSILAGLFMLFRPQIEANERFEKQQNILYAMGVNQNQGANDVVFIPTESVEAEFQKYITRQVVIQGDQVTENDQAFLIDVKKEATKAADPAYDRRLPLFEGSIEGKDIFVVPVRGKGLWDAIWGFVAMDKDMVIHGVYFDHKGETPGLGAEIKQRYFMDDFKGEGFLVDGNFAGIAVAKGNNDPKNLIKDDQEVDALAGATITGDGLSAMLKKDIRLYVPYFKSLN
ncbi:MAG: Na(+)-translocating NADH-quinone reductase subunit C [Flavobacteriaceae bacterium]|jgi:Na+-transporting NADH:ubiquinone oxidoreductase subunit C|nr:Na(+)-translocating NADH-quinone reductase subunit C [Flavobacteriaceae bacterium]